MNKRTEDKRKKVLKWLKSGRGLSKYQCMDKIKLINLGDAIHILRRRGHDITRTWLYNNIGEKFASYSMEVKS